MITTTDDYACLASVCLLIACLLFLGVLWARGALPVLCR
jgi:hypothetical protein